MLTSELHPCDLEWLLAILPITPIWTFRLALAIFDLDETLISADSDHAWGEFVVDNNLVDEHIYRTKNHAFYEDYKRGQLDIDAYMRFSCSVLAKYDREFLLQQRSKFIDQIIKPMIQPKAQELVNSHREKGDILVVVTATIDFITQPIVEMYGITNLIAPIPEIQQGRYTGALTGIPSFGSGKVTRLEAWVKQHNHSMLDSCFYSDSANDIPLLQVVDHPVAVDPDPKLKALAEAEQWPIISLRS